MAIQYWKSGSTDWSQAGSWQTSANAPGAVPLALDSVYFSEGNDNITAGLNQSGIVSYALLEFTRGGSNRVGNAGAVFRAPITTTLLTYAASGGWLHCQQQVVTTAQMASLGGYCSFSGTGTITALESFSGRTDLADTAVVTTHRNYGGEVNAAYNTTAFTTLGVFGGRVTTLRTSTTLNVTGGTCVLNVSTTALAATTANINGGYVLWQRGGATTVTIEGPPGTIIDFSQVSAPLTLATVNIGPGPRVIGSDLVTVSTTNLRGNRAAFFGSF